MFLFRKLLITVLALGLVFSLSVVAYGEQGPNGRELEPLQSIGANVPNQLTPTAIPRHVPAFTKPVGEMHMLPISKSITSPASPCEAMDYSGGNAYYYWDIPNPYGTTSYAQKFTPERACTLTAFWVAIDFDAMVGTPDLEIYVYGDDGFGYPDAGNVIHHETILNADLPTSGAYYMGVDGLSYTFADGEAFHVAWGITQYDPADALSGYSDDGSAGVQASSEYWNSAWGLMLDNWSMDVNFLIEADVCLVDPGGLPDDCYTQSYWCNIASYWESPGDFGLTYYNQRFSADMPETLKTVYFATYAPYTDGDVDVYIWPSNGGFPDLGNEYAMITIPYADLAMYPSLNEVDVSGLGLVMTGDYHVGLNLGANGTSIALLSDDASCGQMRSSVNYGGSFYLIMDLFSGDPDVNLVIDVDACRDVYAECAWESFYSGTSVGGFRMPDSYGQNSFAVKYPTNLGGCDLVTVSVYFLSGDPVPPYAYPVEIAVYKADGTDGLPGTPVFTKTLPVGSITIGAWNDIDFSGLVSFEEDIWVAVRSMAPTNAKDVRLLLTDAAPGNTAVGYPGETWYYMIDDWGTEYAPVFDIYRCCLPMKGRTCVAGEEWPTMGKTFARENSSLNSIGGMGTATDARCYLTKDWDYTGPNWAVHNSPTIGEGKLVDYMTDQIVCLDVNTGAQLWVRTPDFIQVGAAARCIGTITDGKVYIGGGDAQAFNCLDLSDGSTIWSRGTSAFTVYAPNLILNVGGTDVVFVGDDYGNLYAFNAATGADFYASNPFFSGTGFAHKALTTDGSYVYFGVDAFAGQPNLYKIDPATGTEVINFVDDGDGFQLATLHPIEVSVEGLYHAMAYEDGFLYVATSYVPQNQNPVTNGGLLYKINVDDFTIEWVAEANGASTGNPGGVVLDLATVYFGGWSQWVNGGNIWGPTSYSKASGAINWTQTVTNPSAFEHVQATALLTCEDYDDPAVPDWLISGTADWYVNFLETTFGEQVFHRRFYYGTAMVNAPVMNQDRLILGSLDFICALTNQPTARPRLELPAGMTIAVPVPFGLGPSVDITFADAIKNNGCAPLTVNEIILDVADNGTFPLMALSSVGSDRNEIMNAAADKMAGKYEAMINATTDNRVADFLKKDKASSMNRASFAPPIYVNSVTSPTPGTIVAAGASIPIVVNLDGTKIPRGYNSFYAYIDTDDPDYFLDYAYIDNNANYGIPSMKLAIVGGCLLDFTVLNFGMGGANQRPVYNTTKIMIDVDTDGGIVIDGIDSYIYGCDGLVYGWQDKYHVAMNWDDPWSNAEFRWDGILPDPYIDDNCDFITGTALLAKMSTDNGATYTDIFGTVVNYAYVDSIQDYSTTEGDISTWNWEYEWNGPGTEPPYSDSLTEGFAFRARVAEYAVVDVPEFSNFTVSRHAVYSRYGNAIENVFVGGISDMDVGDYATAEAGYSAAASAAWHHDAAADAAWGFIKVPFGPGYSPMRAAINADYSSWYFSPDPEFDSIYVWLSQRSGIVDPYPSADKRLFWCLAELDLPAWNYDPLADKDDIPDSAFVEYGNCLFALNDLAGTGANPAALPGMARFINQFCGFGRGDVNNDGTINLIDIVYLNGHVFHSGNGPFPFEHLGDVNGDGAINIQDILYLVDWYFHGGPAPVGEWALPMTTLP